MQRIYEVRNQINSLALASIDQRDQIKELESFNEINRALTQIQNKLLTEHEHLLTSHSSVMAFIKTELEHYLKFLTGVEDISLRQVLRYNSESNSSNVVLEDSELKKEMVRVNDHIQEDQEVIEDFIELRKDVMLHQISVRTRLDLADSAIPKYSEFTFLLQQFCALRPKTQNRSLNNSLNLSQNMANYLVTEEKGLAEDQKFKLVYLFKALQPIFKQLISISSDLSGQIESMRDSQNID